MLSRFALFSFLLFQLLLVAYAYETVPSKVSVGVLEGPEDDPRQYDNRFWSFSNYESPIQLDPVVEKIRWWEPLHTTRAICGLLKRGVHNLVSHVPPKLKPHLSSYANHFKLPLITTTALSKQKDTYNFQIGMIPSSVQAVVDILKHYKWESFVFLYDDESGPWNLQTILEALEFRLDVQAVWRVHNGDEAQRYLQLLKGDPEGKPQCVLAATNENLVEEIVSSIESGNGINRKFHFVLAEPVGFVEDSKRYGARGSYLITKFALTDSKDSAFQDMENRWATMLGYQRPGVNLKSIPDAAILTYDTRNVLQQSYAHLLHDDAKIITSGLSTSGGLDCLQDEAKSNEFGLIAANYIKKNVLDGVTGKVKFNDRGERVDYVFDVMETTPIMSAKIGTWSPKSKLELLQNPSDEQKDESSNVLEDRLKRKAKIMVTSILAEPYLSMSDDADIRKGNDRFKGYAKDLMDELSKILDWEYEIHLVKDGRYGLYNPQQKTWNGMIGELIREEADLVVAPLTVTPQREEVVDFSKSFFSVGLNILMKKPPELSSDATLGPLSFVKVWGYDIWLLLALVFFVLGGTNFAVSHFTGDPDRIRSLDTKGSDRLSPCSSIWFALGGMVFRGTGIYPRSISHRLLSIVWWCFSLVVFVVYVSSLCFMIIRARTVTSSTISEFTSSDILKSCLEKGHPKVGLIGFGATHQFFQFSEIGLFKDYGRYISNYPDVIVRSTSEGVERVRSSNGSYALIMESISSSYVISQKPCDTMVSAGFLDTKRFGIGFKKNSPLRESVDHSLLSLMESGTMRSLYEKWWHLETTCDDPLLNMLPSIYTKSLSLYEVSGVFYLLLLCGILAVVAAAVEYFIRSKKLMVDK